jgi:hypothetical protein
MLPADIACVAWCIGLTMAALALKCNRGSPMAITGMSSVTFFHTPD